jgi:cytochrome c-type biogenesis protein
MTLPIKTAPRRRSAARSALQRRLVVAAGLALLLAYSVWSRWGAASQAAPAAGSASAGNLLALALPAFLAGLLSFLSPCTLPILPAYFAFTVGARRERVVQMTLAFFLGLASTLVVLGATASAVSQLLFQNLRHVTLAGGLVVICFGVMSLIGKGFSGIALLDRPRAGVAGSYLYGATFALGWTACVGPIFGALLALLAAQGVAVLQGAALAFIYALGLGAPLVACASLFSRLGPQSRAWRLMRGRGFALKLGATTLHLHTTSILSGLLLIAVGALLATGQLAMFSRWAAETPLAQQVLELEHQMRRLLLGRY